ncbi:hypothetical protein KCP75_23855 [Salmonella enterica subsp. enterica]|nr:hypothetical protein KCP75_23855 [Salmonella enterica subsp. enterica]
MSEEPLRTLRVQRRFKSGASNEARIPLFKPCQGRKAGCRCRAYQHFTANSAGLTSATEGEASINRMWCDGSATFHAASVRRVADITLFTSRGEYVNEAPAPIPGPVCAALSVSLSAVILNITGRALR